MHKSEQFGDNKKLSFRRGTARCVVSVRSCQLPRNSAETTCTTHGVDKGAQGAQPPQWPGKKEFFVKIEELSSFT